jgi:hypothetical protein
VTAASGRAAQRDTATERTERTEDCYAQNRRGDILYSGEF